MSIFLPRRLWPLTRKQATWGIRKTLGGGIAGQNGRGYFEGRFIALNAICTNAGLGDDQLDEARTAFLPC